MTIFEILKFNRELLNRLRQSGIRLEDADYIDLFVDFNKMVADGERCRMRWLALPPIIEYQSARYIL